MLTTKLGRHDDGPAIERCADGDDAEQLRDEVAALLALSDLAVPRVLSWQDGPAAARAVTSYVPEARALTFGHLAGAAAVLAEAHRRHIAHGRFGAGSVRVEADGRVVLDGWLGIAPKSDDVAAVGVVLDTLLERPGAGGSRRLALTGLAARARSSDPSTRPGMAALAEGMRPRTEARPGLDPAADRDRARSPQPSPHRAPPSLVLGGAFALLAGMLGVVTAPGASSTPTPEARSPIGAAPLVLVGTDLVRVGEVGDVAVAGRWRCGDEGAPAVLRRDGSVWWWLDVDDQPQLVGTVAGGHTIERGRGADGCDVPLVRDSTGTLRTISPAQAPGAAPPRSPATAPPA